MANGFSAAGAACAFAASCTWALGVTFYARLGRVLPPWAINATRALVSFPALALLAIVTSGGLGAAVADVASLGPTRLTLLGLSMVGSYALGDLLFLRAADALGTPAALSIASLYPLPAALTGVLARGESMSLPRWCGLATVVFGTITVIRSTANGGPRGGDEEGHGDQQSADSRANAVAEDPPKPPQAVGRFGKGVALAFTAAALWAMNVYCVSEGSRGVSPFIAAVTRTGFGLGLVPAVGAITARVLGRPARPFIVPWPQLRPLLWLFAFEGVGGTFVYTYGLAHTSLAVGAALSSLAPVLAVPVALLLGTERFAWKKSLGIAAVVAGTAVLLTV